MNRSNRYLGNAATVLRYLAENGPSTQTQVVGDIHLQRTSVFNIFEYLEQAGLIVMRSSTLSLQKGRPCHLWQLNGGTGGFMTVYIGNTEILMQLCDFGGEVSDTVRERSPDRFDTAMERLMSQFKLWHQQVPLRGVMVIIAGRVDFLTGRVVISRTWKLEDFQLRQILQERLAPLAPGVMVMIENNARMAAWGQRVGGSCIGLDDFLSLSIIDGRLNGKSVPISIGSGVVLDGRIYRGQRGGAGELDDACYRWFGKIYSGGQFPVSLQELDKKSREYFAVKLGESFAHLVNYLAPQRLVVIFEREPVLDFFTVLRREVQKKLIYTDSANFPVEIALDGGGAVIRGGTALLRERFFAGSEEFLDILKEMLP